MSDYLGYYVDRNGYKIVGIDGHLIDAAETAYELESSEPAALEVPTIDVEPVSVQDTEIRPEIER